MSALVFVRWFLVYVISTKIPGAGSYVVGMHQKHLIEALLMTARESLNMSSRDEITRLTLM